MALQNASVQVTVFNADFHIFCCLSLVFFIFIFFLVKQTRRRDRKQKCF